MAGVMSPGRRGGTGAIDAVLAGLQAAHTIYGMKQAGEQAERLQQELDMKQAAQDDELQAKADFKAGKLSKGDQIQLGTKGLVPAKEKDDGAFSFTDADSGMTAWVKKQTTPKIGAPRPLVKVETVENGSPVTKYVTEEEAKGQTYSQYKAPDKGPKDITVQERNTLQNQYDRDPDVRKNKEVIGSFLNAKTLISEKSPAADQALIYAYMKALDPGSVVRETEAESAQALNGLVERAKAKYAAIAGEAGLSDIQRQDLFNQIQKLAKTASQKQTAVDKRFTELGSRRSVDSQDLRFVDLPQFEQDAVAGNKSQLEVSEGTAFAGGDKNPKMKRDLGIPKQSDPTIAEYSKLHNMPYGEAAQILAKRGYVPK